MVRLPVLTVLILGCVAVAGSGSARAGQPGPPWTGADHRRLTPATLETDVRPKRATVRLDGRVEGRAKDYNGTWDVLLVAPGRHVIELSAPGYRTLRRVIDLRPGSYLRLTDSLRRGEDPGPGPMADPAGASRPRRGLLRIEARPGDAAVYLDGEFIGSAGELGRLHGALPVTLGSHRVEVVLPGYHRQVSEIEVGPKQARSVTIQLRPESSD